MENHKNYQNGNYGRVKKSKCQSMDTEPINNLNCLDEFDKKPKII